jgi:hypothetical protein
MFDFWRQNSMRERTSNYKEKRQETTTLKFKIYCKNLLTSIQIAQLVSGVSIAWYYILFTKMTLIQRIGCLIDMIYLKGLIYLFINFYNKAYKLKDNVIEQKQQ